MTALRTLPVFLVLVLAACSASNEPITLPSPYRGRQRAVQPDQGISAAAYPGIK